MNKHIEIWNIARKLKLSTDFYEGLDTLLTEIESRDQQIILSSVVKQSEQFKPFKEAKGMCKKCLRHWCICNKKED